jgi:modulator of FtsH protease
MIEGWTDFFEGQVAAAAALTGLVFVAISINLQRIVGLPGLAGRAGEALLLLVAPVFVGLAALAPAQSVRAVGIEFLAIAAIISTAIVRTLFTSGWPSARGRPHSEFVTRCAVVSAAMVPALVASLLLVAGNTDGLYWQAFATGMCLAGGVGDAWVLLVEILR